jgi:hypothetical protein
MNSSLEPHRLRRLDIQGFENVEEARLAEVAPWLRLAFGLCATLAILGTALASTTLLFVLAGIALLGALSPVHPFDLIYDLGIRHLTGTGPLPRRGAPSRFACGFGSTWLLVTIWAFDSVGPTLGYVLGFSLSAVAVLVSTTDICIPSMIFRAVFGAPAPRCEMARSGPSHAASPAEQATPLDPARS